MIRVNFVGVGIVSCFGPKQTLGELYSKRAIGTIADISSYCSTPEFSVRIIHV